MTPKSVDEKKSCIQLTALLNTYQMPLLSLLLLKGSIKPVSQEKSKVTNS